MSFWQEEGEADEISILETVRFLERCGVQEQKWEKRQIRLGELVGHMVGLRGSLCRGKGVMGKYKDLPRLGSTQVSQGRAGLA